MIRTTIKITDTPNNFACDTIIIPIYDNKKLTVSARKLDQSCNKQITAIINNQEFTGTLGETLVIPSPANNKSKRFILLGLGEQDKLLPQHFLKAAHSVSRIANSKPVSHIALITDIKTNRQTKKVWCLQTLSTQLVRSSYRYFETKSSNKPKTVLQKITALAIQEGENTTENKKALKHGASIGAGINIARELGNLPGNICTPKYLSLEARKLGRKHESISTKVLGEKAMSELGMGSLLSVGHGSDNESQLIIMTYSGGKKTEKPYVLLGKGITFDTGGISLKPGAKMDEMKFDMCGAASVFGTMNAIAEMKLPINVIGVVAAAENMPSGRATKPGDVVTSMSGKTIEVLNTDAEGRLVLCDALTYIERFKPQSVVDMATLTGACIVALGHHASGLMSNDDDLAEMLLEAGQQSGDRTWRLPIWDEYHKQLQSNFADLANIGGPSAGTITAACFLSSFAEKYPWAHLDIAGVAWNQGEGKTASGRPVSLLCQYLMNLANQ